MDSPSLSCTVIGSSAHRQDVCCNEIKCSLQLPGNRKNIRDCWQINPKTNDNNSESVQNLYVKFNTKAIRAQLIINSKLLDVISPLKKFGLRCNMPYDYSCFHPLNNLFDKFKTRKKKAVLSSWKQYGLRNSNILTPSLSLNVFPLVNFHILAGTTPYSSQSFSVTHITVNTRNVVAHVI